jgi:hypothetical protein
MHCNCPKIQATEHPINASTTFGASGDMHYEDQIMTPINYGLEFLKRLQCNVSIFSDPPSRCKQSEQKNSLVLVWVKYAFHDEY